MNYEDAFKNYENGTATEEEKDMLRKLGDNVDKAEKALKDDKKKLKGNWFSRKEK